MTRVLNVGHCHIQVIGTSMECPFCRTVIKADESHTCEVKPAIEVKPVKRRERKKPRLC